MEQNKKLNFNISNILITLLTVVCVFKVNAHVKNDIWMFWDVSDENSITTIDHSKWQQILNKYLHDQKFSTVFNYELLIADGGITMLDQYIHDLSNIDPRELSRYEQLAYWINLYNAITVKIVANNYPADSILDIVPKNEFSILNKLAALFRTGPWETKVIKIASQELTLNEIVHSILIPIWGDIRIHYCLCTASIGSPDLYPQVFTAIEMPKLLRKVSNRFIGQRKAMQWISGKLILSRLFKNNLEDFTDRKDLLIHLSKYSSETDAKKLKNFGGVIEYQFDWSLNSYNP